MSKICPLCDSEGNLFEIIQTRSYYKCNNCYGIFMDNINFMTSEKEKEHYSFHNNDANDLGYQINQYDIYFHNYPNLLNEKYDYIACSEVVEHFHNPKKEFEQFKKMLASNGRIYIMTHIYNPTIDFKNWYYIKDHTHVFLYQKETMEWIANNFGFSLIGITDSRLIIFSN